MLRPHAPNTVCYTCNYVASFYASNTADHCTDPVTLARTLSMYLMSMKQRALSVPVQGNLSILLCHIYNTAVDGEISCCHCFPEKIFDSHSRLRVDLYTSTCTTHCIKDKSQAPISKDKENCHAKR